MTAVSKSYSDSSTKYSVLADIDTSVASTAVTLDGFLGYNALTIQVENNGALGGSGLGHTLALTGGIGGTNTTVPSGLFVTGASSFANITGASYNGLVILKCSSLTKLTLTFTRSGTTPTGLLKIRVLQSSSIV